MLSFDTRTHCGGREKTYNSFPVLLATPQNKLIVLYYKGFDHPGVGSRGQIMMRSSINGGASWLADVVVRAESGKDLRFGSAGISPTGRIIVAYPIYGNRSSTFESVKYIYSDDDGVSWSEPQTLAMGGFPYGQIIEIGGGLLGISTYSSNRAQFGTSDDNGATWGSGVDVIAADAGKGYSEASFAYLGNDAIVGLIRQNNGATFRQVLSEDNGLNWSDQGDTTFDSWAVPGPAWLTPYDVAGVKTVKSTYQDRTELKVRMITATASDIIANGVAAWDTESREDVSTITTSLSGYPSILQQIGLGVCYNENISGVGADVSYFSF